jgi:CRP/FNR family transcriptional regulator
MSSRVAGRILDATRSSGTESEAGSRLSLRLPQTDMAHMVGASRQSVNKVLQNFQTQGLITIEYGKILVHDREGIRRLAGTRTGPQENQGKRG